MNSTISNIELKNPGIRSQAQRVGWVLIAVVLIGSLLFARSYGNFLPDDAFVIAGWALATGFGLLPVAYCIRALMKSKDGGGPILYVLFFFLMLMVFGFALLVGLGFVIGVPDIYTQLYGQPATRHVIAINWEAAQHNRHGPDRCAGVNTAMGHICLDRRVAPGTALLLHGKESVFGFHVGTID